MNYFKVMSLIFGALLILTRVAIHLFPKKWSDFELEKVYTERQPTWVWIAALIGLLIVALTWYMHLTGDVPYSLVITLLLSLTLVKVSQVLFNYKQFREFASRLLLKDRKLLLLMNLFLIILGTTLIAMGLLLY